MQLGSGAGSKVPWYIYIYSHVKLSEMQNKMTVLLVLIVIGVNALITL